MRYLEERGIGWKVSTGVVPIVPQAALIDLSVGTRPDVRPNAECGYKAAQSANSAPVAEGNVGAGAGASVGKLFGIERAMRGGLGSASVTVGGITVAALVAVNAIGDVIDPASGAPIAGARSADGLRLQGTMASMLRGELPAPMQPGSATTLGIVATDAVLTKAQAGKVAQMAHDGFARSINPVHTMTDGDTIFALATGASGQAANVSLLGALGAEVIATAIVRAVRAATGLAGAGLPTLPSARDLVPPPAPI